jgi:hypothetical protein
VAATPEQKIFDRLNDTACIVVCVSLDESRKGEDLISIGVT